RPPRTLAILAFSDRQWKSAAQDRAPVRRLPARASVAPQFPANALQPDHVECRNDGFSMTTIRQSASKELSTLDLLERCQKQPPVRKRSSWVKPSFGIRCRNDAGRSGKMTYMLRPSTCFGFRPVPVRSLSRLRREKNWKCFGCCSSLTV